MLKEKELSVGCVVMAAGNAERFGENKLAAVVDGKTLMERALEAVPAKALAAVCVVTQYDAAAALAERFGFRCVRNDRPEDGLSRTVRLGTEALCEECGAILYLVSDQPRLRRESVRALLDFYRAHPDRIVAASHDGRRGNPCVFPADYFPELRALTGDVGGSAVIRKHENALLLFEIGENELTDVDTKEALEKMKAES
ncbi:MAG: nucleotidyltransferase family protein [Ruminococcaceae bacterium]|nr:nucleotidyltransferase family protein [Oscillospiraceae bacterium]